METNSVGVSSPIKTTIVDNVKLETVKCEQKPIDLIAKDTQSKVDQLFTTTNTTTVKQTVVTDQSKQLDRRMKNVNDDKPDKFEEDLQFSTKTRKTWQTSPEEVEELTRSLSQMKTDRTPDGYCYEKLIEKSKTTTMNKDKPKKDGPCSAIEHQQHQRYSMPTKMKTNVPQNNQPTNGSARRESFLPPLTGFSDSDSSFGSMVCSADDCDKIHCICESLRKTRLDASNEQNGENVSYINYEDDDKWIVTRPTRVKPRDNLRLEGPMDMETTFRSTYDTTAQRRMNSMESRPKSKRSTATSTRCNKPLNQLYLNTTKGRTGATSVL